MTESQTCLIIRHGGQTTTFTLVRIRAGIYSIIDEVNEDFGSDLVTKLVADHMQADFEKRFRSKIGTSIKPRAKLRNAAEQVKHTLSTLQSATCSVDSLSDGMDFQTSLTRSKSFTLSVLPQFNMVFLGRLEGLCSEYLSKFTTLLQNFLAKNELRVVDSIVLSGGGCRMPIIRNKLQNMFENGQIFSSLNPEETIALGAAKQSAIVICSKKPELKDEDTLVTCANYNLFIKDKDGKKIKLVEKYTPLPLRKQFQCNIDGANSGVFTFVTDENGIEKDLGEMVIKDVEETCSKFVMVVHVEVYVPFFLDFISFFYIFMYLRDSSINIHLSSSDGSLAENFSFDAKEE